MIQLKGQIVDADQQYLTIRVPFSPEFVRQDIRDAVVFLQDGRRITPEQRRKAWALIGKVAAWAGYKASEKSSLNAELKRDFLLKRVDDLTAKAIGAFSLSDVDVTTASMYISYLVDFVLENNVPTHQPITELCEDIQAAVYAAAIHKRCIVCGQKAELHHVDRVGMGGDRHNMCHIGLRALPLCRAHHGEAHQHGDTALMEKYHLEAVRIDEAIAKVYKLGKKEDK